MSAIVTGVTRYVNRHAVKLVESNCKFDKLIPKTKRNMSMEAANDNQIVTFGTREKEMHRLRQHHLPNKIDRYLLVWTGQYKSIADVPSRLPLQKLKRAREKARITVGSAITIGFLIGVPFMMRAGRRQRDKGDTVWQQHNELQHNLQKGKVSSGTTWKLWGF